MLELHFLGGGQARLVIQARSAHTEQLRLLTQWKFCLGPLHQRGPFLSRHSCNFFLSQATWLLNLPVSAYSSVSFSSSALLTSTVLFCFSQGPGCPANG